MGEAACRGPLERHSPGPNLALNGPEPGGRLPLLSARPAVTPATLERAATNFAAW